MREIKFRMWHIEDNEMIDWFTLTQSAWNTFRGDTPLSLIYEILVARKNDFHTMQYIGLRDKNGKEIYEDDIIEYYDIKNGWLLDRVMFDAGRFCFYESGAGLYKYHPTKLEIMGNIHENKELL